MFFDMLLLMIDKADIKNSYYVICKAEVMRILDLYLFHMCVKYWLDKLMPHTPQRCPITW